MSRRKKKEKTSVNKRQEYILREKTKVLQDLGIPVTEENLMTVTVHTYWETL